MMAAVPNRMFNAPAIAGVASSIVAVLSAGCQPSQPAADISGRTMGTLYSVQTTACPGNACDAELASTIDSELQRLTAIFSHYDDASDLSRFNATEGTDWVDVPPELADVVAVATGVSALTSGAFDVTVADAVDAWGFGPAPRPLEAPAARVAAGYENLSWRMSPPALRKQVVPLRIDLSAIAKGYAVDRLAYLLEARGINDYIVEIGGELRTAGNRPDGKPWRIGIERPDMKDGSQPGIEFVVVPGNAAVASSGDYRNAFELDGERVSHTIDPRAGAPVDNQLAAVSVIAPSAAQADALATAFMVLGAEAGQTLAEREGIAALFTVRAGDALDSTATTAFRSYLLKR